MSKKDESPTGDKQTIYQAVAMAIGGVKKLGKTERNNFDKYDFVSIDKFLALVNPICAENGLFPHVTQTNIEMYENAARNGNKSVWARFYFDITLYHTSGEALPVSKMMVSVSMNGAQASGSAQSYALKQYFRGMFMIPTGGKDDPDFAATEDHTQSPPPRATDDEIQQAIEQINGCDDLVTLKNVFSSIYTNSRHVADHVEVVNTKDARKAELKANPAGDKPITQDEIPY